MGIVALPSIRTSVTVPSGSLSPCWASAGDVRIPGGSPTSTASERRAPSSSPIQARRADDHGCVDGANPGLSPHRGRSDSHSMIRPPGNRPWCRRSLISGSSHERSFLNRTDQEPPEVAARCDGRPGLPGPEDRLRHVRSPAFAGGRGGVQDWPIIPVGFEGATIAPPEVAPATRSELLGRQIRPAPRPSLATVRPRPKRRCIRKT